MSGGTGAMRRMSSLTKKHGVSRSRLRVPRGRGSSYVNGSSGDSVNSTTHGA
ncbi:hypothetical protein [Streptomyces sp. NBC_00576]|uniref:hypothetical protein n=1 Tax=Streptomyces sp. NBC_00576 TaxID=2903665 RepID=UPI002E81BD05|nr:hypothetical protein [Streptomyces sp. NBC_00576]WUB70246.1 hypothetical protein OG734_09260 [Streptomyces sp. NBC_00576]